MEATNNRPSNTLLRQSGSLNKQLEPCLTEENALINLALRHGRSVVQELPESKVFMGHSLLAKAKFRFMG